MEKNNFSETDILVDAHINPVKPVVIEENEDPRDKSYDDERTADNEETDGELINDDNEEGEGVAYDGDDTVANPQKDVAENEEENIDADSEVHRQSPKENSF